MERPSGAQSALRQPEAGSFQGSLISPTPTLPYVTLDGGSHHSPLAGWVLFLCGALPLRPSHEGDPGWTVFTRVWDLGD